MASNEVPRRTIESLLARYDLEPQLCDLYVEGTFDQEVLANYMRQKSRFQPIIYEIDTVNVPEAILEKHKLSLGNKQRLIALAHEMRSISSTAQIKCLIDVDLDEHLKQKHQVQRLIYTPYTCIEMCLFNETIIETILLVTGKCKISNWLIFYNSLVAVLKALFAFRLAIRELNLALTMVKYAKYMEIKSDALLFDIESYEENSLVSNALARHHTELSQKRQAWEAKLTGDPRNWIHGHDFVEVLAWIMGQKASVRGFGQVEAIERLLITLIDRGEDFEEIFKHY